MGLTNRSKTTILPPIWLANKIEYEIHMLLLEQRCRVALLHVLRVSMCGTIHTRLQ